MDSNSFIARLKELTREGRLMKVFTLYLNLLKSEKELRSQISLAQRKTIRETASILKPIMITMIMMANIYL